MAAKGGGSRRWSSARSGDNMSSSSDGSTTATIESTMTRQPRDVTKKPQRRSGAEVDAGTCRRMTSSSSSSSSSSSDSRITTDSQERSRAEGRCS